MLTETIVQDISLQPGSQISRDIILVCIICMSRNKLLKVMCVCVCWCTHSMNINSDPCDTSRLKNPSRQEMCVWPKGVRSKCSSI